MAPVFSRVPTSASAATASDDEEGTFGDREDEGTEIERVEVDLPPPRARTMSVTAGTSEVSLGRLTAENRRRVGNVSSPRPRAKAAPRKPVRGRRVPVSRPLLLRRRLQVHHRQVLALVLGLLTERGSRWSRVPEHVRKLLRMQLHPLRRRRRKCR